MADPHHILSQPSNTQIQIQNPTQTPFLNTTGQSKPRNQEIPEEGSDPRLDKNLQKLELFLTLLGLNQTSALSFAVSWIAFFFIAVAIPLVALELLDCSDCEQYQIKEFEAEIVASQACLASVSLLCVSHNLRKYGIRKFLFVDQFSGQMARFSDQYIQKIEVRTPLLLFM